MEVIIPVGVPYTQVLEDLRAVIRHELHHHTPAAPVGSTAPADELLSIREAATLLGVTVQTIHEHKRLGRLKFHKLGSRSYIMRGDIMSALQAHQRTVKIGKGTARG